MARYIASNIAPCTYLHIRVLVFVYAQIYICLKKVAIKCLRFEIRVL